MTDSNQDSTFEEDEAFERLRVYQEGYMMNDTKIDLGKQPIDWQKEYQKLFVEQDKHLTRAIEAEGRLAVAKELIADQEIDLAMWQKQVETYRKAISTAREAMRTAVKSIDAIQTYGEY